MEQFSNCHKNVILNLLTALFIVLTFFFDQILCINHDYINAIQNQKIGNISSGLGLSIGNNKVVHKEYTYFGRMEATVITRKAFPNFGNPEEETIIEEKYFSYMTMKSSQGSINKLRNHDFRANILTTGIDYPVFWGKTSRDHNDEPQRVRTEINTKIYNSIFGKYQLYSDITVNGESNGYDWNFTVNPYAKQATGIQSIDAHTQYCVKLYMSDNIRLHSGIKYKTIATAVGKQRISEDEFEPVSRKVAEDSYLGLAHCDCDKELQTEDKMVIPLIIQSPQKFEDFLFNPVDNFIIDLNGKFYTNEDGTEEIEKTIKVQIKVTYFE